MTVIGGEIGQLYGLKTSFERQSAAVDTPLRELRTQLGGTYWSGGAAHGGAQAATGGGAAAWERAVVGGLAAGGAAPADPGQALTIGRDRRCGLTVEDPEVSRRHARVELVADDALLSDVDSRNGT